MSSAWIDARRAVLRAQAPSTSHPYRIFSFGRATFGATDVVMCLLRALRNLGHHVTHFDIDAFRDLVDDSDHPTPQNVHSGAGPRWLDVRALEPAFRSERPQIVLLLAGGLMVREADAQWLRARGVVLAGVTLSDPDVMLSVLPHVTAFDIHGTNARQSVEAYRTHGVRNTVWFPFGIDLSFIGASLPVPEALRADVICLGHAQGREERSQTMEAVAARFGRSHRVRTYGRGWRLPGSQVVSGTRMIQASRGGRLHVNFPGTRAGYVNVKCGVFESIANGGVVVTQRFPEMEQFFEPGREIACYERLEDVPDVLASLLDAPQSVAAMARAAFDRLVVEHSYEVRWERFFASLREAAEAGGLGLAPVRSAQVRDALARGPDLGARPVIVSGFYGANNLGDEAILQSIVRNLRARRPEVQCFAVAADARRVVRRHGLEAVDRGKLQLGDDLLRCADAFVLGGGGLWHDHTFEAAGGLRALFTNGGMSIGGYANLGLLAYLRDVPFVTMGLGVGPLSNPEAIRLVAFLMQHVQHAWVRDGVSAALLRAAAPGHAAVHNAVDCVYGLELPKPWPRPTGRALLIGVNMRRWGEPDDGVAQRIAEAIRAIADEQPGRVAVLSLPMQEGRTFDRLAMRAIFERLGSDIPVLNAPTQGDFDAGISAFGAPDVVVALRLHACLLAHRYRVPAVGLAYDEKVRRHFAEVGRTDDCAGLDATSDWIAGRLRVALAQGVQAPTEAALAVLEARAREMFDALVRTFPPADAPRRLHPFPSTAARNDDVENALAYARATASSTG